MSYFPSLQPTETNGSIGNIAVRWQASALNKLADQVELTEQPRELLKSLTEHFLYLAAKRLNETTIKITGPPHNFTINTATGELTNEDYVHVTGQLSRGTKIHVYFYQSDDWENSKVMGESVWVGRTDKFDLALGSGWYPGIVAPPPEAVNWHKTAHIGYTWQRYDQATNSWEFE